MHTPIPRIAAACFFGICAWPALAQQAEPLHREEVQTLSATVESIDLKQRLVELRDGDRRTTVQVPPEVRNLGQVKVGDEVTVKYYEGFAAQLKKKGESDTAGVVDVARDVARRAPEAKPGGAIADTYTTTVVIEAVDRPNSSVTFTGPAGMTRTVEVKHPDAKRFIGTLKKGDEVELTYTEALAVTVEPQSSD